MSEDFVEAVPALDMRPPVFASGPLAWTRDNLFPGIGSSVLTLLSLAFIVWVVPPLVHYLFLDAVWSSPDGAACRVAGTGACWSFIGNWLPYFTFGSYPIDQRWRVTLTLILGAILIVWLMWPGARGQTLAAGLFFLGYPIVAFLLLFGFPFDGHWVINIHPAISISIPYLNFSFFWDSGLHFLFEFDVPQIGLPVVDTHLWGGIFVSLVVSLVGIVFSLPLGVLLALGRRSTLPIIKFASVAFIEFVRGVPFITVLFMAVHMLPLFVPEGFRPNTFLLPLIGTALFAAAYMAEVVRAGLQAMSKGQTEGSQALGLGYWQTMQLIILPQALTITIPNIVSNFIGLFKDTTLVANVGIFDFLKTVEVARNDANWAGPTVATTGYVFAAIFYFIFCYGMAQYARYMERILGKAKKR